MNQTLRWGTWVAGFALAAMLTGCSDDDDGGLPVAESHYVRVKQHNGKMAVVHLHRSKDDKVIVTSYPYGRTTASLADGEFRRMSLSEFNQSMADRSNRSINARPLAATAAASTPTSLQLGYSPSVGPLPGECYNFTVEPLSNPVLQTNLTISNTASSFAAQTNVNASISGAVGAFKASDTFSYSDNYQNSTNSGTVYFNAYAVYQLSSAYDSLTSVGAQMQGAGQIPQLCGVQYMAVVPAGALVTLRLSWNSSFSQIATTMSDKLTGSYGLDQLSVAVKSAKSISNSTLGLDYLIQIEGGGSALTAPIMNAAQTADTQYLTDCENSTSSDATACDSLATAINSAVGPNISSFQSSAEADNPDYSTFAIFANGVSGTSLSTQSVLVPGITDSDVLAPYQSALNGYLTLLNQVATLGLRAQYLSQAVGSGSQYNWTATGVDLQNILSTLGDTYGQDVGSAQDLGTMIYKLNNCLYHSTSTNVATLCAPITNNTSATAYDWYGANGGNPNWLAQQNAIALQYVGSAQPQVVANFGSQKPLAYIRPTFDVVYIDNVGNLPGASNIANQAALVAFADAPYPFYFGGFQGFDSNPAGILIPYKPQTDLGTFEQVAPNSWIYYSYYVTEQNGPGGWVAAGSPLSWIQVCGPTFTTPCELSFTGKTFTAQDQQKDLVDMTRISEFFETD